jgi:hypothetical protein
MEKNYHIIIQDLLKVIFPRFSVWSHDGSLTYQMPRFLFTIFSYPFYTSWNLGMDHLKLIPPEPQSSTKLLGLRHPVPTNTLHHPMVTQPMVSLFSDRIKSMIPEPVKNGNKKCVSMATNQNLISPP